MRRVHRLAKMLSVIIRPYHVQFQSGAIIRGQSVCLVTDVNLSVDSDCDIRTLRGRTVCSCARRDDSGLGRHLAAVRRTGTYYVRKDVSPFVSAAAEPVE